MTLQYYCQLLSTFLHVFQSKLHEGDLFQPVDPDSEVVQATWLQLFHAIIHTHIHHTLGDIGYLLPIHGSTRARAATS
jgi:hypothetical protein